MNLLANAINVLAGDCYKNSKVHGFWDEGYNRNKPEMISLMHAELSECLEYLRNGNKISDHIPDFSGVEEELADVLIRVFDFAGGFHLRLGEALIAKMKFNEGRPTKHGKEF